MGWSLIKKNSPKDGFDSYKIVEILVDTEGDLFDIPVDKFSPGSIAYTADRSVSATLNTKGEWVKHVGGGSGGSGGGGGSGGKFVVTATIDETLTHVTWDKTIEETFAEFKSGHEVQLRITNVDDIRLFDLVEYATSNSELESLTFAVPGYFDPNMNCIFGRTAVWKKDGNYLEEYMGTLGSNGLAFMPFGTYYPLGGGEK